MDNSWNELQAWFLAHNIKNTFYAPSDIKRLDLSNLKLSTLPKSFSLLSELIVLDISGNLFKELPEVLENLTSLTNLNIRRNKLKILPSFFSKLNVRSLNANSNSLENIEILQKCNNLRVLDLSSNNISNIENIFTSNNELRVLNLSSNFIKDIKPLFSQIKEVQRLNLSENLLTEIPSTIEVMQELTELRISDNQIKNIDSAIFELPLEVLDISSNEISDLTLAGLEDLEHITIDFNEIETIKVLESFAPYLISFSADGCELKECLPLKSTELTSICYSSNLIKEIPSKVGDYIKLEELDIDGNSIVDLPDNIANLTSLKRLYIEGNPLSENSKKVIQILHPEICDIHMKRGIEIKEAEEEDLEQMANILSLLFEIEQDFEINYEKQLAGITKLFNHAGKVLLVAKYEDEVVGMVTMQRLISSAEGDFIGQVEDLIVKNEYRKMGVGSRLLNKIRAIAQSLDYKRIQLSADIINDNAKEFYTRRGFHQTHLKIYHFNS